MFNKMNREDSHILLQHVQDAYDVIFSHLNELAVGSVERTSLSESLDENVLPSMPMIDDIRKRFKANMIEEMLRTREAIKALSARSSASTSARSRTRSTKLTNTKSTKQSSTLTVATKAMKATKPKAMKAMKSTTTTKKAKARKAKK